MAEKLKAVLARIPASLYIALVSFAARETLQKGQRVSLNEVIKRAIKKYVG